MKRVLLSGVLPTLAVTTLLCGTALAFPGTSDDAVSGAARLDAEHVVSEHGHPGEAFFSPLLIAGPEPRSAVQRRLRPGRGFLTPRQEPSSADSPYGHPGDAFVPDSEKPSTLDEPNPRSPVERRLRPGSGFSPL